MSVLQKKLSQGQRVFTAEISPPKGAGIKRLIEHAHTIKDQVDAINITDSQRAIVRMSSIAACKILLDEGVEPVCQMTCRDRNSIGLQSDLMGASALGIENILCLTGDPVKVGDCPNSKSVFEVESVGLLKLLDHLQNQKDGSGNKTNKSTKFFSGAVVNPTLSSASQLTRMEKKIEAGAKFFQTQANYDPEDFISFLKEASRFKTPILAGILILSSAHIAKYIKNNIPGIKMPDSTIQELENSTHPEKTAILMAVRLMKQLEPYCQGFHLMTIRQEEWIPQVKKAYEHA